MLILQHARERDHPFNTARMVRQGLGNSQLICGTNEALSRMDLPIGKGAGLLYPSNDAKLLSELLPHERPGQLIIIDGTWSQAKTMIRDLPQLHGLPRFKLAPTQPGQYRIRLEPTDTSLSTVEAVVAALRELEPKLCGLDELISAFDSMVQGQLDHPKVGRGHYTGGPKSGRTTNIPKRLLGDANQIVVAYGEADYRNPASSETKDAPRPPLFWVARRLGTGEAFAAAVQSDVVMTDSFLDHLELTRHLFDSAIPVETFREHWRKFLRPDDIVAVYNQGTLGLLASIRADIPTGVTLKSIHINEEFRGLTLSQIVESKALGREDVLPEHGRAGKRLANAVALVRHFRSSLQ